jgi:hypothetical protein
MLKNVFLKLKLSSQNINTYINNENKQKSLFSIVYKNFSKKVEEGNKYF